MIHYTLTLRKGQEVEVEDIGSGLYKIVEPPEAFNYLLGEGELE